MMVAIRDTWHWSRRTLAMTLAAFTGMGWGLSAYHVRDDLVVQPASVLPADFEHHEALLLGWDGDLWNSLYRMLVDVAHHAHDRMQVVVMVPDESHRQNAEQMLRDAGVSPDRIRFVQVPITSVWARDYGPLVVKRFSGGYQIMDTTAGNENDLVPQVLGRAFDMPVKRLALPLPGGNVLSNGAGLILTARPPKSNNNLVSQIELSNALRRNFGAQQIVYLESLQGEANGHVDMFCTFTSRDTVVVGQYSPRQDAVNAAILDRNAELLSEVETTSGKLKVVRIPMPQRVKHPASMADDEVWFSYTNVLFANGKLLVPTYDQVDPAVQQQALDTYRRLLPGWEIVGVDCSKLILGNGGLHCIASNLYRTTTYGSPTSRPLPVAATPLGGY